MSLTDSDLLVSIVGNLRCLRFQAPLTGRDGAPYTTSQTNALKLKRGDSFSSSRVPRKRAQERDEGLFFD